MQILCETLEQTFSCAPSCWSKRGHVTPVTGQSKDGARKLFTTTRDGNAERNIVNTYLNTDKKHSKRNIRCAPSIFVFFANGYPPPVKFRRVDYQLSKWHACNEYIRCQHDPGYCDVATNIFVISTTRVNSSWPNCWHIL